MASALFALAVGVGVTLIALLLATLVRRDLRIWPTPGEKTWQSYVWWPLFRGLNLLCFAVALTDRTPAIGLPMWLRALACVLLVASTATFLYAFFKLGRDNSYGAQDGLVTAGIYQWSRNPQNAMLIVVYASLALTTDTARTYMACAAMMAVYFLMVLAEEPWLEQTYGEAYRAYCKAVPRFFNIRRAFART
jgi:protein-S-isoprenylcysteine O-methyltransferase Ste14